MGKILRILMEIIFFLMGILFLAACDMSDDGFTVRRESVDVGTVSVGDSVHATFTFKNNSSKDMVLSFLPECDCTTVSSGSLELKARKCGQLDVSVAVEQSGEFLKYVYVQAAGSEAFITVSVKGRTK